LPVAPESAAWRYAYSPRIRLLAANPETGFRGRSPNGAATGPDEADYYTLLGVPFTANHAEITRAYRRAMKRVHPDRQRPLRRAAFEDLARRLNAAYAVLSDPLKRQAYDRTIRQQVIQDQIMRRYVGGFQTFDDAPGPGRAHLRREPTAAERRERISADRQASLTLVVVAVGVTALILVAVVVLAVFNSLLQGVR
jgi:DnaJ-class molecular chaperone